MEVGLKSMRSRHFHMELLQFMRSIIRLSALVGIHEISASTMGGGGGGIHAGIHVISLKISDDIMRPLENGNLCSSSRKAKISTTGAT